MSKLADDSQEPKDELEQLLADLGAMAQQLAALTDRVCTIEQCLQQEAEERAARESAQEVEAEEMASVAEEQRPAPQRAPTAGEHLARRREEAQRRAERLSDVLASSSATRGPTRGMPPTPPAGPPALSRRDFEAEIALKWLGRIGVVALTIGAAFFLQYAFASGWIGPVGQVSVAIIGGLVLLVAGDRHRQLGRRAFGEALSGGGIAILYTSIYAAYAFYPQPLLSRPLALGLLILVTGLAVTVGVYANALSTLIVATIGGFLAPVLVRQAGSGQGVSGMLMLFGYIAVLDVGLLVLSFFRQWRVLQMLSFLGTWFIIWGWLATSYTTRLDWPAYATMLWFFLVFAFVPVVRNLWQRLPTCQVDLWLIILNAAFFFPTVALLPTDTPLNEYLGLYAVITAIFYLFLGSLARQRSPDDKLLILSWLGLGLAFIILAVPLQLRGHWIMVGWAVQGAILVWIGHQLRMGGLRIVGLVLQGVAVPIMLWWYMETFERYNGETLMFGNPMFLSLALCVLALGASLYVYRRSRRIDGESEGVAMVLEAGIVILVVWGVAVELIRGEVASHFIMLTWAAGGTFLVWMGSRLERPVLRIGGQLLQGVAAAWVLGIHGDESYAAQKGYLPVVNGVFLSFVGVLAALGVTLDIHMKSGDGFSETPAIRSGLPVVIGVLALWGLTRELLITLTWTAAPSGTGLFAVSALWSVYATVLVGVGMVRRSRPLRLLGLAVFGLVVLKVFLWDLAGLTRIWRILSFVCLGGILIGVGYVYNRYGEVLLGEDEEKQSQPGGEPH